MQAKSIKGKSPAEIQSALQNMTEHFRPTLAFVFISVKQDRKAICEIFGNEGIDVIGATSCGEFTEGYQSNGEIAALLFDLKKDDYCILFEDIGERSLNDAAATMAKAALQKFRKPAFILCSSFLSTTGKVLEGESLLRSIENVVGPEVNIFGGMAGDDISFTGTYVFTNNQSTDYGMVALVLNEDKINLNGMAISGWKPIGVFHTITKAEGNLIFQIDNQPAIETYLRFLGADKSSADDQVSFFNSIGVHYPFQIERENREPKMCSPIGYDTEKQAMICESDVVDGAKFRFSTPPDFDIIETVVQKARDLKNKTDAKADAMLIFSCAGRFSALGPMAQQENKGLSAVWNVPMAGFYTYGEFGRAVNSKHEFHSTTCCWVTLEEK